MNISQATINARDAVESALNEEIFRLCKLKSEVCEVAIRWHNNPHSASAAEDLGAIAGRYEAKLRTLYKLQEQLTALNQIVSTMEIQGVAV